MLTILQTFYYCQLHASVSVVVVLVIVEVALVVAVAVVAVVVVSARLRFHAYMLKNRSGQLRALSNLLARGKSSSCTVGA